MGYVAARIDDVVRAPRTQGLGTISAFLNDLASHLQSPHLARALLGALLCRWLFRASEPMCQNVYSQKEMKLYESLLQNGRASEVQHLDKLGVKLLFADEKFQENELRPRAKKLLDLVERALKEASPNAPGFRGLNDPREWSENAVKLKQTLMISPKDYRIHYCIPDSRFESLWMQAEDAEGLSLTDAEAKDKLVSACLFPALAELEPKKFGEKPVLAEVLVSNKVFFPSSVEKQNFDPNKIIAKAVVLVG
ncbi:hypothetical protein BDU57DRAFT_524348 [Ampelomyces quisqualis]|uniref:Uncharacterized protein n=1 Tax=Ampelomyces quisqualis TaxID=50730 RepID=A0A6A5Q742_AMPQU|nr:hypothetical protein BDU57DRAFT_524348 [Ampelomyces quisqualis]